MLTRSLAHRGARLAAATMVSSIVLAGPALAAPQDASEDGRRAMPPVETRSLVAPTIHASIQPLAGARVPAGPDGGVTCEPIVDTYASTDFDEGSVTVTLPPGMVEQEIAAVTFDVPADSWPLLLNRSDIVWAQSHFNPTTTEWSYLVWEGTPDTGTLVATFSSDGTVLPHVQLPVGAAQAVLLSVEVDPGDPDQIVLMNDGSNQFTVGFRIDAHNDPPSSSCTCLGGFGTLPAVCCPPNTNTNAWPAMDFEGPQAPTRNWIFARDCPGGTPLCFEGPDWLRFDAIPASFVNDWAIRVRYTPLSCPEIIGACCLADATCVDDVEQSACADMGGFFQGEATVCAGLECPEPVGACCVDSKFTPCFDDTTEAECGDLGGFWYGPGSVCGGTACPRGACCFPGGGCSDLNPLNCDLAGGTFGGYDTECDTFACFPMGACCLPDGGCLEDVSPEDCDAAGGIFEGDGVTCDAADCPQPLGACCLASGDCFLETQENCVAIPGAFFAGAGIPCESAECDPDGACCLDSGGCFLETESNCENIPGASWAGPDTECATACGPACAEDLDGDGSVATTDLLEMLEGWGDCDDPCPPACLGDLNGDCAIDTEDLLGLLSAWGPCE